MQLQAGMKKMIGECKIVQKCKIWGDYPYIILPALYPMRYLLVPTTSEHMGWRQGIYSGQVLSPSQNTYPLFMGMFLACGRTCKVHTESPLVQPGFIYSLYTAILTVMWQHCLPNHSVTLKWISVTNIQEIRLDSYARWESVWIINIQWVNCEYIFVICYKIANFSALLLYSNQLLFGTWIVQWNTSNWGIYERFDKNRQIVLGCFWCGKHDF